jgi:hypothetical protein
VTFDVKKINNKRSLGDHEQHDKKIRLKRLFRIEEIFVIAPEWLLYFTRQSQNGRAIFLIYLT